MCFFCAEQKNIKFSEYISSQLIDCECLIRCCFISVYKISRQKTHTAFRFKSLRLKSIISEQLRWMAIIKNKLHIGHSRQLLSFQWDINHYSTCVHVMYIKWSLFLCKCRIQPVFHGRRWIFPGIHTVWVAQGLCPMLTIKSDSFERTLTIYRMLTERRRRKTSNLMCTA